MGTAVRPAKTSPGPWDAFADVDVFVDEVLAELTAMARDGTRPQRSGLKPPLAGEPRLHAGKQVQKPIAHCAVAFVHPRAKLYEFIRSLCCLIIDFAKQDVDNLVGKPDIPSSRQNPKILGRDDTEVV
jgi:hypothetical protein